MAQDLPTHWPGTGGGGGGECTICGRVVKFPRASTRRCLTFPHGVYSTHRLSSRSFSSPTRCTGFANSPSVDGKLLMLHGELPTPPLFASWLVCPSAAPFTVYLYTAGPATFRPLTAALDSSRFMQGGGYFIELCNASCVLALQRINYFHPGANAVLSHLS